MNEDMRKIVTNLKVIKDYGEFPRGQNYLFSRYKNMGLVFMGNKKTVGSGKNARLLLTAQSKVKLTKKGRGIAQLVEY